MKKVLATIMFFLLMTVNVSALDINSKNAVLYNLNDDTVVMDKNKDNVTSIASLTKIMTVLVAIENIKDYNASASIKNSMVSDLNGTGAYVLWLSAGEKLTYNDLLYETFLPSAADAAQVLAYNVAGSLKAFVEMMNDKASKLGLTNTKFSSVTGLDDNDKSSVDDIAKLLKYALQNEKFKEIFDAKTYTSTNGKHTVKPSVYETAEKYKITIPGILGGKTGYTYAAGRCLASIAYDETNDIKYMLITTQASTDNNYNHIKDASNIYTYYYNNYKYHNLVDKDDVILTLSTKYGKEKEVSFKASDNIKAYLDNSFKKEDVTLKYTGVDTILTSMNVGDTLGTIEVIYKDKVMDKMDIKLEKKVEFSIIEFAVVNKKYIMIGFGVVLLLLVIMIVLKKRH